MSIQDEDEEQPLPVDEEYDDRAHQACYIFKPAHEDANNIDGRPKKRRKTSKVQIRDDVPIFPQLLGDDETGVGAKRRHELFHETWQRQQAKIDKIIYNLDETAVQDVVRFVEGAARTDGGRLQTGLIAACLDGDMQNRLLKQYGIGMTTNAQVVAQLDASQATNLQTALKNIIKTTISKTDGYEGYQEFLLKHKRLVPMNFDLELLQLFAEEHDVHKFIVSISDVEAFDMSVLSDIISSLGSWSDRIHFVLLLGLATTVELFESRLPTSIARLLDATVFDLTTGRDINYEIFRAAQADPESKLWLGPATCTVLVEMTKDQETTSESFSKAIKFAHMSHFFANPLAILLSEPSLRPEPDLSTLCEAIRNTDSFQKYAEEQLASGKPGAQAVRNLLNNNDNLLAVAHAAIAEGQQKMAMTFEAVDAFEELPVLLSLQPPANASAFDIDLVALAGPDFIQSDPYISITMIIEKMRSDHLLTLLSRYSLAGNFPNRTTRLSKDPPLRNIFQQLQTLQAEYGNQSIRNAYDPSHPSHATTVTQQGRVAITKQALKLTPAEQAYTDITDSLLVALESYFSTHITRAHYTNLFMHEAFVYDLKAPLVGSFAPNPRYAVERALGQPGDYLGCECCAGAATHLKHDKMPPTSVLWRLWCEAGAVVNVRDLWEAFCSVLVHDNNAQDGDEDQGVEQQDMDIDDIEVKDVGLMNDRLALALFYRGLAELKMLGFVKPTKRKPGIDCLAKTTWAGL